ncbi:MAG TPA: serine hydrolase domain-containing protein [Vicinamibacterales bacterium]|nr:serine hydrolase domain-containing protein [Vicinamibacterales bacterium]
MTVLFDNARKIVQEAVAARVFPAATVDVGDSASSRVQEAFGRLTFLPNAPPAEVYTVFDLASLTKVVATTTIVMSLVTSGSVRLEEPVSAFFDDWRGPDREEVTLRDLLEHASGLADRLVDAPLQSPMTRREFEYEICRMRLEYKPRTCSVYSDLDFILVGFLIADRGGRSLSAQFHAMWRRIGTHKGVEELGDRILIFDPSGIRPLTAPTIPEDGDVRRGRMLVGEVHDSYAAALGGSAGHAGLFGSVAAVGGFARLMLRAARGHEDLPAPFSPELVRRFIHKSEVPRSSRALGWDTMLPTSSCGTRMSASAFGHVGFTGTSLWIDPDRDRYFVLLTNRACGGGTSDQMQAVRRAFHDALADF